MIITKPLPSALGPGLDDEEMRRRFNISTQYADANVLGGYEVRLIGAPTDVARAIQEMWDSGDPETDAEFFSYAFSGWEEWVPPMVSAEKIKGLQEELALLLKEVITERDKMGSLVAHVARMKNQLDSLLREAR